jgi:hypothetical protein
MIGRVNSERKVKTAVLSEIERKRGDDRGSRADFGAASGHSKVECGNSTNRTGFLSGQGGIRTHVFQRCVRRSDQLTLSGLNPAGDPPILTRSRRARPNGALKRHLAVLTHPSLLVVDEIGYMPIHSDGAMLFFQLMSRRYEHAPTVLTLNTSFGEPGNPWRRSDGCRADRPAPSSLPRGKYPRQLLPHDTPHRALQSSKLQPIRISGGG